MKQLKVEASAGQRSANPISFVCQAGNKVLGGRVGSAQAECTLVLNKDRLKCLKANRDKAFSQVPTQYSLGSSAWLEVCAR